MIWAFYRTGGQQSHLLHAVQELLHPPGIPHMTLECHPDIRGE